MPHLDANNPAIWTGYSYGGRDIAHQAIDIWGRSSSGVVVTEEVALQLSTLWACIKVISEDIAGLPWHVFRREQEGRKRLEGHPIELLLDQSPNSDMDSFVFRELLIRWALSYGNAYAEIETDRARKPVALWPIHPSNIRLMYDDGELVYIVQNKYLYRHWQILHLKGPSPDGILGWPVLAMALHTIGLAIASEQFGAEYFANGAHLTGILEAPGALTPENRQQLQDAWARMYEGPTNRHRFAVLDGGLKWHPLGVSPEAAQFLETRKFEVAEICRWFRVSPTKVMDLERATYNNVEHMALEYVSDALLPWVTRLEKEFNRKLFSRRSLYSKLMLQGQLRSDSKARGEFYRTLFNMGALSINEIRAREEQNPIGPEGEERFMQTAMATVDSIVRAGEEPEEVPPPWPDLEGEDELEDEDELEEDAEAEPSITGPQEVAQAVYGPVLIDLFAHYAPKAKTIDLAEKLLPMARTILRAHGRAEPEELDVLVRQFAVEYRSADEGVDRGATLDSDSGRFVERVLNA